ncbi:MAG: hypothetical protein RIT24_2951, partial [Planctomycetota bacterium]
MMFLKSPTFRHTPACNPFVLARMWMACVIAVVAAACCVAQEARAQGTDPGKVDESFGFPTSGADYSVNALALQPDGKVLLGGFFTTMNGVSRNRIARLNSDGSLDTGFDPGTGANDAVYALALQPDGKVLLGGYFTAMNGVSRNRIARLNSDGSLDTGFDPGTGANDTVRALALQPDGKVLVGGSLTTMNGLSRNYIARLNSDGSLDTGFDPGTGANGPVRALALQSDGKMFVGGSFTTMNGVTARGIARLDSAGGPDTTFVSPIGSGATVTAMALQPDGRLIASWLQVTITGPYSSYTTYSYQRLFSTGNVDGTFAGVNGTFSTLDVRCLVLQSDGKVLIGGTFSAIGGASRNGIARLTSSGLNDSTFNPGTGTSGSVYSLALQPDGKVLVGGAFGSMNGLARSTVARLYSGGAVDLGFLPSAGVSSEVLAVARQLDGKLIVGGYFASVADVPRNRIARLNSDGSLDTGFNPGTGANNYVLSLALQSDGKVLVGGWFTTMNGVSRNYIARL